MAIARVTEDIKLDLGKGLIGMLNKQWLAMMVLLGLLLTACGGTENSDAADVMADGPEEILLGSTSITPNERRETIVLRNGVERYDAVDRVAVKLRDLSQDEQPVTWEGAAERHHDADGSYWVIYPEFTHAGQWMLDVTVKPSKGREITQSLVVRVLDEEVGVANGMQAIPSDSFTWNGRGQPSRITTDLTPNEAYYQMTVAEAVTSGKPSVIMFATPGLCTRNLCPEVVDSLDPVWRDYRDAVNFVHVEIYNLDTGKYVPAMDEWGLVIEPWIYLIDADGVVVMRYDGLVGYDEISPAIEALLSQG